VATPVVLFVEQLRVDDWSEEKQGREGENADKTRTICVFA
jgi:hypothetical protein